jgi:hypothetical protein
MLGYQRIMISEGARQRALKRTVKSRAVERKEKNRRCEDE